MTYEIDSDGFYLLSAEDKAQDKVASFQSLVKQSEYTVARIEKEFAALGAHLVFFSSQPKSLVQFVQKDWKIDVPIISDPTNQLANYLREEYGWKGVQSGGRNDTNTFFRKVHRKIKMYGEGMTQPGVLIVRPKDGKVLYNWGIIPEAMNLGGAKDRPKPEDILQIFKYRLANNQTDADPLPKHLEPKVTTSLDMDPQLLRIEYRIFLAVIVILLIYIVHSIFS
eukprot:Clim_evm12s209 gene=Clim_evmTU12s209